MTRQLEDGVRALMLDAWYVGADVLLCHTLPFCGNPRRSLADGLGEVRDFLASHRSEVVTLLFESYAAAADVAAAFAEAGLLDDVYVHAGGEWPTLGEMIGRGERLVVLTDDRLSDADRARECGAFHGRIPNFVTVDYYEIGDVFDVVGR